MRRELCQLVNLPFGGVGSLQDAPEHGKPGFFIGAFKGQAQRGAADDGRIESVGAVGDHNERDGRGAVRELVDLLDQHVDACAILVMRLHLAAARREVVRFVDDQYGTAHRSRTCSGLGKGLGDTRRKLADMSAASNIRWRFKTDDALVDGTGDRGRDARC